MSDLGTSLRTLAFALLLAGTALSQERPNLVLAIADDLDPEHLGFCGNPLARTPSLDHLAAEGVRFSVLYAQPTCRPALTTLLSGRWPHQTGIVQNSTPGVLDPAGALPALLRERGYATFCGGKFWEGDIHAYGFTSPEVKRDGFARARRDPQGDDAQGDQDELFRFLERHASEGPWFVWWAPSLPHIPHQAPKRFAEPFAEVPVPVPAWFRGKAEEYTAHERRCLAMEAWLDAEFARLVAKLAELGELEQTVIVFLADNGWSTGLPSKNTPFDKGVRSPLVLSAPGQHGSGRRVDALVDLVDVHATLLDYAGVPARAGQSGKSLRPQVEGAVEPVREWLFGAAYVREGAGTPSQLAYALYARNERWKYMLYLRDVNLLGQGVAAPLRCRRGQESLFDVTRDPFELVDLAASSGQAQRLESLRERTLTWWRETGGGELELARESAR